MKLYRFLVILLFTSVTFSQGFGVFNPDTVKSYKFDTGKMWTFDYPPTQYFEETYNFSPQPEWFDNVRLSALRIPGCSASFISEDGLIVTNYHCSDFHFSKIQKEGEDLFRDGFYAKTLEEERKVPGFHADRLEFIKDITEDVQQAMAEGANEAEKIEAKKEKVNELIEKYNEETNLKCELVTFYNGGKYALYGYKIFHDVRLVFTPEWNVGQFGGNEDNFTYPRYDLDFTMYRVYDDEGKPLKVDHHFIWSENPPDVNDVLFSVGNPGRTMRLLTIAQLEYMRDVTYRNYAFFYDTFYNRLEKYKKVYPDKADLFEEARKELGNGQKALTGFMKGLSDPYFLARKNDFEKKFKAKVYADDNLKNEYGHVWKAIEVNIGERRTYGQKLAAYQMSRRRHSYFFDVAQDIIDYAENIDDSTQLNIDDFIAKEYDKDFDYDMEKIKLSVHADYLILNMGDSDKYVNELLGGKKGMEAAEYILSNSSIDTPFKLRELLKRDKNEILHCGDPFINYILSTRDELAKLEEKETDITNSISVYEDLLGRALFGIYGTTIPPDATFTLRITDGVMKDYKYNGTTAPLFTTFYGLYNRYYSFLQKYPWDLPEKWLQKEKDVDLSTKYNFLTTFDLVGGSSGSAVINEKGEIVGLAFDGNIESLTGDFLYQPEINRAVNVTTSSIHEALKHVYNAQRILKEVTTGKISE